MFCTVQGKYELLRVGREGFTKLGEPVAITTTNTYSSLVRFYFRLQREFLIPLPCSISNDCLVERTSLNKHAFRYES